MRDVDTLVHLAARIRGSNSDDLGHINGEATLALHDAARRAGVRRFLLISTVAVRSPYLAAYPYARSKLLGERILVKPGIETAVLRLSTVFGPGSPFAAALVQLGRLPVLPLGLAGWQQPIDVDDAAAAIVHVLRRDQWDGAVWEVGGPQRLTLGQCVRALAVAAGRQPPRLGPGWGDSALGLALRGLERTPFADQLGPFAALIGNSDVDSVLALPGWTPQVRWADLLRRSGMADA